MFIPTTKKEIEKLGWKQLDIILVTGDCYIDSPLVGVSVIGHCLINAGFRVGIIGQPSLDSSVDIARLGEPSLFWGVTGGCIDSMVANRTASGKPRRTDDYTPGGVNDKRPDRAVIAYSNLIRTHFKSCAPIVLGGLEASLRRIAHYDYTSNKIRKSILFDSKADYLLYSMADKSVVELARHLKDGLDCSSIRGLCYVSKTAPADGIALPDFDTVQSDNTAFSSMFTTFYHNNDPITARVIYQKQDTRYLVQNPPPLTLTQKELDEIHGFDYMRDAHPYYLQNGPVKALDTIRFSILTHRGCYGECSFCSIAVHQGRTVRSRSKDSILREVKDITRHPLFKGNIMDVGGPTANMYGFECTKKLTKGACENRSCLFPEICPGMEIDHAKQIDLLNDIKRVPGVKRVFVTSGIRYDMILADQKNGIRYLQTLIRNHISGQLKIAPEHSSPFVLNKMGKPGIETLYKFRDLFNKFTEKDGKKQFLSYYFIAAHPGCRFEDMKELKSVCTKELKYTPEQVQLFTPTPSTRSTMMYCTGMDPFTGEKCFVEKSPIGRQKQMEHLLYVPGFLTDENNFNRHHDVKRGDVKRGDVKRGDVKRGDAKRGDAKRGDAKRGDAKRGDAKRGDAKRGDAKRGDAKRGDAKRGDAKRGDAKRGDVKRGFDTRSSSRKRDRG